MQWRDRTADDVVENVRLAGCCLWNHLVVTTLLACVCMPFIGHAPQDWKVEVDAAVFEKVRGYASVRASLFSLSSPSIVRVRAD